MSERVICESAYEYVLFERSGAWLLTFMLGGVIETDVSVEMLPAEIEKQKSNPEYVKQLVHELKINPDLLGARRISPSVWPSKNMSQEELKAAVTRRALNLCNNRISANSGVALPRILASTKTQLEWLLAYFEGKNSERAKLRTLVFGHYAVREIDQADEEFVDALKKAFYLASRTADGLKVDEMLLSFGPFKHP